MDVRGYTGGGGSLNRAGRPWRAGHGACGRGAGRGRLGLELESGAGTTQVGDDRWVPCVSDGGGGKRRGTGRRGKRAAAGPLLGRGSDGARAKPKSPRGFGGLRLTGRDRRAGLQAKKDQGAFLDF